MKSIISSAFSILLCIWVIHGSVANAAPFNGFDVENALIPVHKIMQGGPPRDGIPAINNPRFISAGKADFLEADSRVLGVQMDGLAKAYPLSILNWHEVVNDRFGEKGVVVTFCPLCGTGVVYHAGKGQDAMNFGVSGLLYNSDVLLYDRGTESLWSQLKSQAISGPLKGQQLEILPAQLTTWSVWLSQYHKTLVLSDDTGFNRDYSRNPYEDYETAPGLYFPVEFLSYRYHPKERVIGLKYKGVVKAYPFAELAKLGNKGVLRDRVAGESLSVEFDAEIRSARVYVSGKELATINAFWFAWYAFYPDTLVFSGDKP